VRIGWSGSDQSIGTTLKPRLAMLAVLQRRRPFELVIITNTRPAIDVPGLRWSFVPWRAAEEAKLGEKFDIGIMPLQDDEFQKGKCGLKLLQYMAAGLATIASPVGVNDTIIEHGLTGFKARTDADWCAAIELLLREPSLRAEMGRAGRERCVAHYSVHHWLPVLLDIFEQVAASTSQHHGQKMMRAA
jgi:glycosyltransferase involved in cell wall biosynthesis